MAIYHCTTKPISRSAGRSAVAAAAYRSASCLTDERTGMVHDYTRKQGVISAVVLLPDGGTAPRSELWNAAEAAERRKDGRTAREWIVALPSELEADARQDLAHAFGADLARRYGVAVDVAIHQPDEAGDQRNHHAHILTTTRQAQLDGTGRLQLGDKATLEQSDKKRRDQGLGASRDEIKQIRARWAELANQALARAGQSERIDHRSYADQGLDKVASTHLGPTASAMERRGERTERGDLNRTAAAINQARAELFDLNQERKRRALFDRAEREPEQVMAEHDEAWQVVRRGVTRQVERVQLQIRRMHTAATERRKRHDTARPVEPGRWQFWKRKGFEEALAGWQETGRRLRLRCQALINRYHQVDALKPTSGRGRSPGDRLTDQRLARLQPDLVKANQRARTVRQEQQREAERRKQADRQQQRARERSAAEFKRMALKRRMGAPGFTDRSKQWQALPEALREQLDHFNRQHDRVQAAVIERIKADPEAQQQIDDLLDQAPGKDKGLSL